MRISELIVGKIYSNQEIMNIFKCANSGGMCFVKEKNILILFANHEKLLYEDGWLDNLTFHYTEMGKSGDQNLNYKQNRRLNESFKNNVEIHLFELYKTNEYQYVGIVTLTDKAYQTNELGEDGKLRKVWKFPMKRKIENYTLSKHDTAIDIECLKSAEQFKAKLVNKEKKENIEYKAKISAKEKPIKKDAIFTYYYKNLYIEAYTKNRANGMSDLCEENAPFKYKNEPFLQVYYVKPLEENGHDAVYKTVALCPNCYQKMKILKNKSDKEKLIQKIKYYLKLDNDLTSINAFEKLFN